MTDDLDQILRSIDSVARNWQNDRALLDEYLTELDSSGDAAEFTAARADVLLRKAVELVRGAVGELTAPVVAPPAVAPPVVQQPVVQQPVAAQQVGPLFVTCNQCGKRISASNNFCTGCGHPTADEKRSR